MMAAIDMDEQLFTFFNFPLIVFNITANFFYACSLFLGRGKLKEPLNVLLGFLVLCPIVYCATLIGVATSHYLLSGSGYFSFMLIILGHNAHSSMTCYVLLNFYYYVSIVPVKRVLMVWTKKNIKPVIYVALISETMLYLVNGALRLTAETSYFHDNYNQTVDDGSHELFDIEETFTGIIQVYMFLCVLIMMVSSFSTAHYLGKHMRNFAKSASRLTSPKIQSQVRVTVAGVLQGLLYLLYYIFYLTNYLLVTANAKFFFSYRVFMTATTLFFSATTVNIGISQTVIRQRAADVFRGFKALCGVNKATNDVSLHTSPVT